MLNVPMVAFPKPLGVLAMTHKYDFMAPDEIMRTLMLEAIEMAERNRARINCGAHTVKVGGDTMPLPFPANDSLESE